MTPPSGWIDCMKSAAEPPKLSLDQSLDLMDRALAICRVDISLTRLALQKGDARGQARGIADIAKCFNEASSLSRGIAEAVAARVDAESGEPL